MKFARLGMAATLLISCTMAPNVQPGAVSPKTLQNKTTDASSPDKSQFSPTQKSLPSESIIDSVQGQARADHNGDKLSLKVIIRRPEARIQRLELERIRRLRAWVQGPGISEQIFNLNDYITVQDQNTQTQLEIEKIPRGKNRIVTVQGYDFLNDAPELLNGATLKAVYDSPADANHVTLTFTWRSTLLAEVIEQFLKQIEETQDAEQKANLQSLLDNLDRNALDTLLDHIVYGENAINGNTYRLHPDRVSAQGIVEAIVTANGAVPTQLRPDPVPAHFQKAMANLNLVVRTPKNVPFSSSDIQVRITDPASQAVVISGGNDTAALAQIVPGNWKALVTLAGLNGGVKADATVTIDGNGNATLSAGTAANPVILPPVIKAISKSEAGAGTQITLTGDGFDATAANNIVKFGNTTATVVSGNSTSLVVEVPNLAVGAQEITVSSNDKTSNIANFNLIRSITQLSINQGQTGDSVTLTLAGYDPTTGNQTVTFTGGNIAAITGKTNNTITVLVPTNAQTGSITVAPDDGGAAMQSPVFTVVGPAAPSLSSPGGRFNDTVTINVTNYDPTADTPTVTFAGNKDAVILSKTANSISVRVPIGAQTGPITIKPSPADGRAPFDSPVYTIGKPVISSFTPSNAEIGNVVTVSGGNLDNVTQVKIGDLIVPPANVTLGGKNSLSFTIPAGASTGPISVTSVGGTATSDNNLVVGQGIVSLSTSAANVGDSLTINVAGFDPTTATSIVKFPSDTGTVTATVTGTTASSITVTIPAGAKSGVIQVEPQGFSTLESSHFIVGGPSIASIGPGAGPFTPGQQVVVTVANHQNVTGFKIGGQNASFIPTADPNNFVVTIPNNPANNSLEVTAANGTATSTFNLSAPPIINSTVAPVPSNPTTTITLNGHHYTTVNKVTIGGNVLNPADYTIVNDGQIIINNVPNDPVLGPIEVTNPAGSALTSLTYKEVTNLLGESTGAPNTVKNYGGFCAVHGVNLDRDGNIYVSDLGCNGTGSSVHKFDTNGNFIWQTGTTVPSHADGYRDGTIQAAQFNRPEDSATDIDGNIYVADTSNHAIRKIYVTGPNAGLVKTLARVPGPEGIEISPQGKLYVSSTYPPNSLTPTSAHVFEVSDLDSVLTQAEVDQYDTDIAGGTNPAFATTSNVTVVAGGTASFIPAFGNVTRTAARFRHLEGLGVDGNGIIYIADVDNYQIRKINLATNTVSVLADFGFVNVSAGITPTLLSAPTVNLHEIRVDANGNVFVPAPAVVNATFGPAFGIYLVKPDGKISFIAGDKNRAIGLQDGPPLTQAQFSSARGIDIGPDGSLYVADTTWGIRKIERFHAVTGLQVP